jgi:glycosyltransferase involved in cell wall biosynthesis
MGWFGEEPGGLNRMYAGLLGGLEQLGVSVSGLVAGVETAAAPPNVSFFERRDTPTIRRLYCVRRSFHAALHTQSAEIVAAHFALYALPLLDLLRSRRFVFHFHGPWGQESRAEQQGPLGVTAKRVVESLVYRRADRFIALSCAFADLLGREYGIRHDRIFVVPGGVDARRYAVRESRREARDRFDLPQDRPLVLSVRRLIRRVGLEGLIDAVAEVRRRVPEALLLIAGRGPLERQLRLRIASLGLEDHVRLLGFVADEALPLLYRACDVSIVPSVALEGFGLTAIESLAAGTPVLVTPIGGLPEVVGALDSSLVLPDTGTLTLADALARALSSPGGLPAAERCARYARERFDWPVIARRVLTVYEH